MELDIYKDFIRRGIIKNKLVEYYQLLKAITLVKYMTIIDDQNRELPRKKRGQVMGFSLPHTASYNFIMRYINDARLYEVIDAILIKIEKNNPNLSGKIAIRTKELKLEDILKGDSKDNRIVIIEELEIENNLFTDMLHAIDDLNLKDFEQLNQFLDDEVYELAIEYEESQRKRFESKRKTVFKGDMPISINNSKIFDKTFIVEQWIRRIIKFVLMIEYGADWIKAFKDKDLEDYENMRRKLVGREVLEFKDDHLLWYASISYLASFIKRKDIRNTIENVTSFSASELSKTLFKIGDIRNEMAHNRTITKAMEEDFNKNFGILEDVIINFKKKTIYKKDGEFVSNQYSIKFGFINYFNKLKIINFKSYGTQSFLKEQEDFFSIILLPCKAIGYDYIDISVLLERFDTFKDYIISFYINMHNPEYQVIISKRTVSKQKTMEEIINIFFDIVKVVGTDMPYELQDSRYTCNPKIWFYNNSYEEGLKTEP